MKKFAYNVVGSFYFFGSPIKKIKFLEILKALEKTTLHEWRTETSAVVS